MIQKWIDMCIKKKSRNVVYWKHCQFPVTHTNTHSIIGNATTKYEEFLWGKTINQSVLMKWKYRHFGTYLDISVLGTGQFGTWMRQYSVLINCQYFCTSSSLIYDPKVDRCVFDNSSVDWSRRLLFLYIDFYLFFHNGPVSIIILTSGLFGQYRQ
jgi:hypothetical protein